MLSNQILQKVLRDTWEISGFYASVWNQEAVCQAACDPACDLDRGYVEAYFAKQPGDPEFQDEAVTVADLREGEEEGNILVVHGSGERALLAARFGASQLRNLNAVAREKPDKERFIQNLLLGHLLPVDILNQAKKMRIPGESRRAVFIVSQRGTVAEENPMIIETLRGMFTAVSRDFVTQVNRNEIVIVKSLQDYEGYPELSRMARSIVDTLSTEAMVSTRISHGSIARDLRELAKSYKEAAMAMEVGRVFYEERGILSYRELGIGRLIHQLPTSLCEAFLKEVLAGNAEEIFEEEELQTVYTFFDNNLNISETARKLYVHRNTLTYRLEKIQKKTGLDVRVFEDAMTFKIAVMVDRHLRRGGKTQ